MIVALLTAVLGLSASAHAVEILSFSLESAAPQLHNIPSAKVIAILKDRFEKGARPPLATGDLHLSQRWNCREFFTEASGSTNYRFRSFSFREYDAGMIEDQNNASPKIYVYTKSGLVGDSASRVGAATEIRVDRQGNLRMATPSSYIVCFKKYLARP